MSSEEILTIREVAALLKIGEKTAYTMAQDGDLPDFKVQGSGGSVAPTSTRGSASRRGPSPQWRTTPDVVADDT